MRADQESILTSDRWKKLIDINNIELRLFRVQTHSFIGIGERLHDRLRRSFRKISHHCPDVSQ